MSLSSGGCLLLVLAPLGRTPAQEAAVFTPPQAYPVARYEADWSRNPFTLKTVVQPAAQDSFARDMAIGSHYGTAENPTVVVINTKTNERILLRKDKPAANGMSLKSVRVGITRGECEAEIVLGTQSAVVKYDAAYLGQMAASGAGAPKTSNPQMRTPGMPALPVPGVARPPVPAPVKVTNLTPPVPVPVAPTPSATPAPALPAGSALPRFRQQQQQMMTSPMVPQPGR